MTAASERGALLQLRGDLKKTGQHKHKKTKQKTAANSNMNPKSPKSPWLMPVAGQGNLFNCLPDELVVHICCYMDSYSMLKFGR